MVIYYRRVFLLVTVSVVLVTVHREALLQTAPFILKGANHRQEVFLVGPDVILCFMKLKGAELKPVSGVLTVKLSSGTHREVCAESTDRPAAVVTVRPRVSPLTPGAVNRSCVHHGGGRRRGSSARR